jgi:hypothetical protein
MPRWLNFPTWASLGAWSGRAFTLLICACGAKPPHNNTAIEQHSIQHLFVGYLQPSVDEIAVCVPSCGVSKQVIRTRRNVKVGTCWGDGNLCRYSAGCAIIGSGSNLTLRDGFFKYTRLRLAYCNAIQNYDNNDTA